jgi:type IV fimbrial biogenesis protein FimT
METIPCRDFPAACQFRVDNSRPRNESGFTLVELMIGLSIVAILAGLSFGSFSLFGSFTSTSEINGLIADLYYGRSEALKRRSSITMCRSEDGSHCAKGSHWENGWIVFVDRNRNRLVRNGLESDASLTLGSGYYYYIMFSPTGEAYPRNTFRYCTSGHPPRAIILYSTGRARISSKDSSGKPLKC